VVLKAVVSITGSVRTPNLRSIIKLVNNHSKVESVKCYHCGRFFSHFDCCAGHEFMSGGARNEL